MYLYGNQMGKNVYVGAKWSDYIIHNIFIEQRLINDKKIYVVLYIIIFRQVLIVFK